MVSTAMQVAIDRFRGRVAPQTPASLADVRAAFTPAGARYDLPTDVAVVAVEADGVGAYWLTPPCVSKDRVLLYLHGGAYRTGSLASHGELAARVAAAVGARALFVEYRLAPEHPYPAAADDALLAWRWLVHTEGIDPREIVLVGDSAGGGLSLALLVALRDAGEILPAGAALMSPWTDLSCSGDSLTDRAEADPVLSPARVRGFAADYLGGADPRTPRASPLFASLTGLPPLLIQVGTAEILLSDAERTATAAARDEVNVTLQIGPGLPHVYQAVAEAPEAATAIEEIGRFLRRHLDAHPRAITIQ